jgi:predicted lipoprotein with Yx(FWY)xxD motif
MTLVRRRFLGMTSLVAAATIALSACAGQTGATATPAAVPTNAASAAASTAPSAGASAATGSLSIAVVQDAKLGSILVGQGGKTLYLFTPDSGTTSACTGQCASSWPPLTVTGGAMPAAGTGVTGAIATITRPEGTTQVTVNGHPVYYFSGDTAAGQTNGQGLNAKWYVLSPAGDAVGQGAAGY